MPGGGKKAGGGAGGGAKLVPREYVYTEAFLVLRAAERFGVAEAEPWWDRKSHGQRAALLAYELIRQEEESRERAAMMGVRGLK
jgi:hypothetical protein